MSKKIQLHDGKFVSYGWVITVLAFATVLSFISIFLYCYPFKNLDMRSVLQYIPSTLQGFFAVAFGILGIQIFNTRSKGTKYYPACYTYTELEDIIEPILRKYQNTGKYEEVVTFILDLTKTKADKYNDIAQHLQVLDIDFFKLWNDFNFFGEATELKEKEYYFKLKKCVYIKVYEYAKNKK